MARALHDTSSRIPRQPKLVAMNALVELSAIPSECFRAREQLSSGSVEERRKQGMKLNSGARRSTKNKRHVVEALSVRGREDWPDPK